MERKKILVFLLLMLFLPCFSQSQKIVKIVVLPPIAIRDIEKPPPSEMIRIVIEFRKFFKNEIEKTQKEPPTLSNNEELWWVLIILSSFSEDRENWKIQVLATREKKRSQPILIETIPINKDTMFDITNEAKRSARKTIEKIEEFVFRKTV